MFLAWILELLGGRMSYDIRTVVIRFIIFDLWVWIFLAYGFGLLFTGQLD